MAANVCRDRGHAQILMSIEPLKSELLTLGGAKKFWESHAENLTTLENSMRVSKVSRLRFEAQAGGELA